MVDIILGIAFILLGIIILIFYSGLKKNEKGTLSINFITAGIGCIMIGLGLTIREIF